MRLERASFKAIKFACLNFHYAKRIPAQPIIGWSVFNAANEWCGVVCFNAGIEGIQKPYNLQMGQVAELVRVALNGKQEQTSKALSIAIREFRKTNPLVKLVVSYADTDENHLGIIYQATNWYFQLSKRTSDSYIDKKTGAEIHSRQISKTGLKIQFGATKKCYKLSDVNRISKGLKHKYIYPLDKALIPLCKQLSKPYPKKEQNAQQAKESKHSATSGEEGGSSPTVALK